MRITNLVIILVFTAGVAWLVGHTQGHMSGYDKGIQRGELSTLREAEAIVREGCS